MSTSNIDNTQVERSARGIFQTDIVHSRGARLALAGLRLVLGWTFLWAFIDKLFGLGFATPSARAWINGGTPAQGFMKGATEPFAEFFHSLVRTFGAANDWLFMLGLLGIGIALITGCGLKIAAWTGTLLLFLMYLAEFPLGDTDRTRPSPTRSPTRTGSRRSA